MTWILWLGLAVGAAATTRVAHIGTFNLKHPGEQWKSFTSNPWAVTRRPGFVWNGRIAPRDARPIGAGRSLR